MVRFAIGDIVSLASEPCPCGRNFGMTLSTVEGRLKSLCVAGGGKLVTHRQLDEALARVDGLEQYGLMQETPINVRLDVIGEDGQGKRVARDAEEALQGLFGPRVEITAKEVPILVPERSGKFLLAKRGFPLPPGIATAETEVLNG